MLHFSKFALLICCLIFSMIPIQSAQAQDIAEGSRIVDIVIDGTVQTDPQEVLKVMELKPGSRYSSAVQREDLQSIANLGYYNPLALKMSAENEGDGIRLFVEVEENPTIESITFVGNLAFKTERLMRELDFKAGDLLPLAAKSKTRRAIQDFYGEAGYTSASIRVSVEAVDETDQAVFITIVIDEGERIKIKDLLIEGNEHFSDWHLRTMVSNAGSWLIFNNYYDDRAFDQDIVTLATRYRSDGFLDVVIRRGEFVYDEEKGLVSPKLIIEEGPRYRVEAVKIYGRTHFTEEEVNGVFNHLIGETYNGYDFSDAIEKLRALYGNQGYANVQLDGTFNRNPEAGTVELVIDITENDVVYIGDVVIKTQNYDYEFDLNAIEQFIDYTSPGVTQETVEREVRLKPGQKFRTVNEVRTEDRLRRLGFFEDVNVTRRPTEDPAVDDVIVEVKEDPAASFISLSAGVGELSGPSVGVNYINPNLFGDARVLNVGATLGSRVQSYNISYLDRYFGDTDTSMEAQVYRRNLEFDGYGERTYGGSVEFGEDISDYDRQYLRLKLEQVDLKRRDQRLRENVDSYWVSTVRGLMVRDTSNPGRWKYEGYRTAVGTEVGWADYFLLKFTHEYAHYHALSRDRDWVYHYAHSAGLIPYDSENIGISERLFLGGTGNLRGFRPRGAGPKDEGKRDVGVGGSILLTQRHELRHRFSRRVSGRIFLDAGVLEEEPFHLGRPRAGVGPGVSVDVGPFIIDVDLAAPVLKSGRDQTRVLHFKLRSNF